jgi:hypothetical protein
MRVLFPGEHPVEHDEHERERGQQAEQIDQNSRHDRG